MARLEDRDPIGRVPTNTTPGPEGASPKRDVTFHCSDINPSCNWQSSGQNENELRSQIEQHGREHHGIKDFSEDVWNRVRKAMHRNAA